MSLSRLQERLNIMTVVMIKKPKTNCGFHLFVGTKFWEKNLKNVLLPYSCWKGFGKCAFNK